MRSLGRNRACVAVLLLLLLAPGRHAAHAWAADAAPMPMPTPVSFSASDGGTVYGDLYGAGPRGLVLVHGGRYDKASWAGQAPAFVAAGFRVLAIDLRGYGASTGGPDSRDPADGRHLDVLAAVRFLRDRDASHVAVLGASMGGDAAARAAEAEPAAIDRLVLLAAGAYTPLTAMPGRKLFIVARDDIIGDDTPRLPAIRAQYDRAAEPKRFVVLDGSAHAQQLFATAQGKRALAEILRFLTAD